MRGDLFVVLIVKEVEDHIEYESHYDLQWLICVHMFEKFQVVSSEESLSNLEKLKFQLVSRLDG